MDQMAQGSKQARRLMIDYEKKQAHKQAHARGREGERERDYVMLAEYDNRHLF